MDSAQATADEMPLGGARAVGNGAHFCDTTNRAFPKTSPPPKRGGGSPVSEKWGEAPGSHNPVALPPII